MTLTIDDRIAKGTRFLIAGRLAAGQDHARIRRELPAVAVKAIQTQAEDEYEAERLVAVVQRTIEAELGP